MTFVIAFDTARPFSALATVTFPLDASLTAAI
jgi:hypothetical protein